MVEWVLFYGLSKFCFRSEIKALKEYLKKWNKEEFGDLAFRKKSLMFELLGLDAKEELLGLSHEEQSRQTQVKGDIEVLATMEETF